MNNGPLPRAAAAAWQEARPARSRTLTALGGQAAVRERGIPTPQAPLRVKAKLLPHRDLPPEAPLLGEAAAHQFNHSKHILGPPPAQGTVTILDAGEQRHVGGHCLWEV